MVNGGAIGLLLKFGLLFFGILGLVFVIAILTPHIARWLNPMLNLKILAKRLMKANTKLREFMMLGLLMIKKI